MDANDPVISGQASMQGMVFPILQAPPELPQTVFRGGVFETGVSAGIYLESTYRDPPLETPYEPCYLEMLWANERLSSQRLRERLNPTERER